MENKKIIRPTTEEVKQELERVKYNLKYKRVIKTTIYALITVAAVAVLIATLWLPVLEIYGDSMSPTFKDGEIVVLAKGNNLETGDVVAFYYNNKILMKRFIADSGDWVDLDEQGNVYVNGKKLSEPYLEQKAYGLTNIQLPYQVPDGKIFVMGDNRAISVDSRNTTVGCVTEEQIVGKVLMRIWPLNKIRIF